MATEDIEGPGGGIVRMIVARGMIQTATPMPDREIPEKYQYGVGEEIDLPSAEAKHLYDLGMVDRPGECRGGVPGANITAPAIGPSQVGLVRSVTG